MKKSKIFKIIGAVIAAILVAIIVFIGLKSSWFGFASSATKAGTSGDLKYRYDYTWDNADKLTGIDIDWINGNVDVVVVGDTNEVKISEQSNIELDEKTQLKLSSSSGTLKIKWKDSLITFGFFQSKRKNLRVEVPSGLASNMTLLKCDLTSGELNLDKFTAEKAKISTTSANISVKALEGGEHKLSAVSGKIEITNVKSDLLSLDTTSGDIVVGNGSVKEMKISTTSGKMNYIGAVSDKLKAGSVSGDLNIESAKCPEDADLSSVSGNLNFKIPDNNGFLVSYSSVSGKFQTDFDMTGGEGGKKSGNLTYKGGGSKFDFSTTSGNMNISKK